MCVSNYYPSSGAVLIVHHKFICYITNIQEWHEKIKGKKTLLLEYVHLHSLSKKLVKLTVQKQMLYISVNTNHLCNLSG